MRQDGINTGNKCLGFQRITAATLASATALTVPDRARMARVNVYGSPVWYRSDGVDPVADAAMNLPTSSYKDFHAANLDHELHTVKFLRSDASTVLFIEFFQ